MVIRRSLSEEDKRMEGWVMVIDVEIVSGISVLG